MTDETETEEPIAEPADVSGRVSLSARVDADDALRIRDELEQRREAVKSVPFALLPTLADVVRDVIRLGLDALDERKRAKAAKADKAAEKRKARKR